METLSETPAGEAHHNKEWCRALPTGLTCVSPSLSSYKDYPAHQPFIKTPRLHRPAPHMYQRPPPPLTSPASSFPESHSAAIISALRNLQEKIRRLELEKRRVDLGLQAEQPSTRQLFTSTRQPVTSTQRQVDLDLQALGRDAPPTNVTSTQRQAEQRSDVTSTRRHAEQRPDVTSTRRQAEQPSDVTSTRRHAEQRSDVTSTRRQAEQPSDVTSTRRHSEQRSDITSTRRQAEQRSDLTSTRRERRGEGASDGPQCNQVLLTQLAAAEARCQQLERQLELMRRTVRLAQEDRTSLLHQQVSMATEPSGDPGAPGPEHAQCEKLERLEREYIRMTLTQNQAEKKMGELEVKLEEEERQRKLVQDKAELLQTGLEANRILLQSVSPRPRRRSGEDRRPTSDRRRPKGTQKPPQQKPPQQKPPQHRASCRRPHYSLCLGDLPFVAGTAVGCSHSVRANVQAVLSLLKHHPPTLTHPPSEERPPAPTPSSSSSSSSSSTSLPTSEEELREILSSLQEELRLMSLEQGELMRRVQAGGSEPERRDVLRDQERLLLRMERKGEHIRQLHTHTQQIKKLRRACSAKAEQNGRRGAAMTAGATRGRSFGACERVKANLTLLKDMRALQTSLRT